jgi:molybdopterin molybdotransferase
MGLPGNPVAVMVTFLTLARPLILRLAGAAAAMPRTYRVGAGFSYRKKRDRREYVRARLEPDGAGGWTAQKFPRDGAGILSSMTESDGFVVLAEGLTELAPGSPVDFLPFAEVID